MPGWGFLYKEKAEGAGASGDYENEDLNFAEASKYLRLSQAAFRGTRHGGDLPTSWPHLRRQKKYAEAIATYEEFLRIFPNSSEATAVRSFIVQIKKDMNPPQ
ncbi:MAG: hypothetical protein IPP63_19470 [Chloracidobacterium sp.]|nr:hypothetical protein [Chloracidobacterium sp.]